MSEAATLDWDDEQPVSRRFGDVYFSRASGLDETRHVFLGHNRLPERFATLQAGQSLVIGETGFGTGLNFLAAWQCFDEKAPPDARLHFFSVEKYPLAPADLARALALWPELKPYADALLDQYSPLTVGSHRFNFDNGRVCLTLLVGDVLERLPQWEATVDAWFLDGFAPAKNPEMWQPELFRQMARLSAPGATFATFTSAGTVRRGLADAGFTVEKVAGFGHKREMSRGWLQQPPERPWQAPWLARPRQVYQQKTAIVVGGGIAGVSTAASLAARGWQVTIVERHHELAQGGSGNPQGVLYAKLSPHFTPQTWLVLAGFAYTVRLLKRLLPDNGISWQQSGVLQLAHGEDESKRQQGLAVAGLPAEFLRPVDAAEASELAGLPLTQGGLYFGEAGWVHPPALVAALAHHPNIGVRLTSSVIELDYNPIDQSWLALGDEGPLALGEVVILAGAEETNRFDSTAHLPIKKIRGQITRLPATAGSAALKTTLCGEGYIAPVRNGEHTLGASFNFERDDLQVSPQEHVENLTMLQQLAPDLYRALDAGRADAEALPGRAAFRATSPDYLPIIGPVADADALAEVYSALRNDATLQLDAEAPWLPGLYVNTAHGSRGMITAPLSGELIAAYLEREPFPVSRALREALHPNRFTIRKLMRKEL
jgi:tRNA 5-methylaminomethyl-2-thiouridine biosynthesis bifunctional protein